ncbi:MAG: SPFH domain-containing protein [Massilia sp.]|nr:SPFH domain-containing protein [Massilia sp.]
MKKIISLIVLVLVAGLSATGCTIVDTGEVGLRVNFDKTIESGELVAGSFNQTVIGKVLTFPVKDVSVDVRDMQPLAADNSTMKDFDISVVYNIMPAAVSDLYINKSRSFHMVDATGDIYLMHAYIFQTARNAVYKTARKYEALNMNDSRAQIEQEIQATMTATLNEEKLNGIVISQVRVGGMVPSDAVKASADNLVRAKNEEKTKEVEVQIARKEAERIAALNANAGAISYMQAQAQMKIAEGIAAGKVHTVVIPYDFKGMVNVGGPK